MGKILKKWFNGLPGHQTGLVIAIATVILALVVLAMAMTGLGRQNDLESRRITAAAIDRAARQCYALEGAYPPTLEYLEDNYGLVLDHDRYHYLYEVIGSNIHPIIEVLDK